MDKRIEKICVQTHEQTIGVAHDEYDSQDGDLEVDDSPQTEEALTGPKAREVLHQAWKC